MAVTILAVALVFYSLVEAVNKPLHYPLLALGTLCFVAGTLYAFMIEFKG